MKKLNVLLKVVLILAIPGAYAQAEENYWAKTKNGCAVYTPSPLGVMSSESNDVIWKGKCKDAHAEGRGVLTLFAYSQQGREEDVTVTGTWVHGKMSGKVRVTFQGSSYEGNFVDGHTDGEGNISYSPFMAKETGRRYSKDSLANFLGNCRYLAYD
ncbi:MAG: hypothetical protein LBV49_09330 [Azonexus sp.]|jgi:hypothetical protein|nr:hypothetical protein [Azonexus sp.]